MAFIHQALSANGSTSLGRIVAAKALLDFITNDHVATVSVNSGGTGYVVGETFDIVGGTALGGGAYVARGIVTAESSGVVTGVRLLSAGAYSTLPGLTGLATTNASAAGNDDLTVDITTETAEWTADRSTYTDDATDFEWIATSVKATNPPTVGLQTGDSSGNGFVKLLAATGFSGGETFATQPNASPVDSCFVNMPGTDPEVYLSATERRLNFLIRNGNNVQLGVLGLFVPFTDTDANYPLPLCAFGQSRNARPFSENYVDGSTSNNNNNASVVNAAPKPSGGAASPYFYLDNLSTEWLHIARLTANGVNGARSQIWPQKQGFQDYDFTFAAQVSGYDTNPQLSGADLGILQDNTSSADDGWFEAGDDGGNWGHQGVAPLGANSRLSFLVQPHIISNQDGSVEVIGILDGLQAVHGRGLTAFEELGEEGGPHHLVFPDTNSPALKRWIAMEKA